MEVSDVLVALEDLKSGIAAVRSANENVERAATAARKVCEAFGECSAKIDDFPNTVFGPINGQVAEIAEATAQMVKSCTDSVDRLRAETAGISSVFSATIEESCSKIQNDISEFHKELGTFDSKLQRLTNRVEEKTDGVVDEIRRLAGGARDDIQQFQASQNESNVTLNKAVSDSRLALKTDIDSAKQDIKSDIESAAKGSRDAILGGIGSVKNLVVAAVIFAFVAAACAVVLVVKAYGA